MAIVVEEESQSNFSIIKILMWLVILGVILAAVYFIFFKRPDIIPGLATPADFKDTEKLSKLRLPKEILTTTAFLDLKQYVSTVPPEPAGRQNPFLPF